MTCGQAKAERRKARLDPKFKNKQQVNQNKGRKNIVNETKKKR